MIKKFDYLAHAESKLIDIYPQKPPYKATYKKICLVQIIRWAILQHYGVAETPMLDVTQSLRVACAFALNDCDTDYAFLHVLGVPQLSGGITTSSESDMQVVKLLSACPPLARRPHLQEGYLLTDFPNVTKDNFSLFKIKDLDFARRLISTFKLKNHDSFWEVPGKDTYYSRISNDELFPVKGEDFLHIIKKVKKEIMHEMPQ